MATKLTELEEIDMQNLMCHLNGQTIHYLRRDHTIGEVSKRAWAPTSRVPEGLMGQRDDLAGFEVFQATKRARRLKENEVSLTKTNIVISHQLSKQLSTGEMGRVVLMFNSAWRTIGIRAAASDEHGYKACYRSISSRKFYSKFDIHERGRFRGVVRNGVLIVNLKEAVDDTA